MPSPCRALSVTCHCHVNVYMSECGADLKPLHTPYTLLHTSQHPLAAYTALPHASLPLSCVVSYLSSVTALPSTQHPAPPRPAPPLTPPAWEWEAPHHTPHIPRLAWESLSSLLMCWCPCVLCARCVCVCVGRVSGKVV